MRNILKKIIAVAIISVMVVGILVGCGSKTVDKTAKKAPNSKDNASQSGTSQLTEISVMVFDRGNAPEGQGSVTDNRWTQWINEEMAKEGIKVNFIPIPRSEEKTKIPVLMASGTAFTKHFL